MYGLIGRKKMWNLAHDAKLPNFIDDILDMDLRCNKHQLTLIQQKLKVFKNGETMDSEYYENESIDSNL